MQSAMVIVGAGQAGARAAVALRDYGWDGDITLIGDEAHLPYERPPLSKDAITSFGDIVPKTIHASSVLHAQRITHIANSRVVAIDRTGHAVKLNDGREVQYARLLLATGARARVLPNTVAAANSVLSLRTFADALSIRAALTAGSRVIIIGGGFIGLELAASAIKRGVMVTLIEAAPRLLMRGVPASIAKCIEDAHRRAGVAILTAAEVGLISSAPPGQIVSLKDGRDLWADTVVAGIGAIPETGMAEAAGLAMENGIAVDEYLATADPDILAAGDCCSFPHELYNGRRVRLEAWRNAQGQGSVAAANMLGRQERYAAVPWFWSGQYENTLQVVGLCDEGVTQVERSLPEGGSLSCQLSSDGRLVAASGFGRLKHLAREIRAAETLIGRRATPDPHLLADPAISLCSLVSA